MKSRKLVTLVYPDAYPLWQFPSAAKEITPMRICLPFLKVVRGPPESPPQTPTLLTLVLLLLPSVQRWYGSMVPACQLRLQSIWFITCAFTSRRYVYRVHEAAAENITYKRCE